MKIGLVPGSFKPYHAGHDSLIRIAADENDVVIVFSSTTDRLRPREIPLYGADMQQIIDKFVKPTLPSNVQMISVGVPVAAVWQELEKSEKAKSKNTFTIYSDSEDILKYKPASLAKYAPKLYAKGQIALRGVDRNETVNVSGTAMREFIQNGDVEQFISMLPPAMQKNGKKIYNLLLKGSKKTVVKKKPLTSESLLRSYVSYTLKRIS